MNTEEIYIPDIGDFESVDVIDIFINIGDSVKLDDSILAVESDKASMDIPTPYSGIIKKIRVKIGDKVKEGMAIASIEKHQSDTEKSKEKQTRKNKANNFTGKEELELKPVKLDPTTDSNSQQIEKTTPVALSDIKVVDNTNHAGPSVRKFARIMGVNLNYVRGSGPKDRILKEDVETYVKGQLNKLEVKDKGISLPSAAMPVIDFNEFGHTQTEPLPRIKKISGANLHRNWIVAPHVTQFDDADITDLDDFRRSMKKEAGENSVKLTLLAFIMKACAKTLKAYPIFNSSISSDGDSLVMKNYYNIGFACDTPDGLIVPVVKDLLTKDILEIAEDLVHLSNKAKQQKLNIQDIQGGCFTISSLGGIGGGQFTPIINCPEVAILGVSETSIQPIYNNVKKDFEPRLTLPLSLSYDHRIIDGSDGARFIKHIKAALSDVRRLLL